MDVGIILGIIGIFLALAAIGLHLIFRDFDRERIVKGIENRLETFNHTARELLGVGSNIIKEVQEIRSASQHLRPELSIFLASQWGFIEKILGAALLRSYQNPMITARRASHWDKSEGPFVEITFVPGDMWGLFRIRRGRAKR